MGPGMGWLFRPFTKTFPQSRSLPAQEEFGDPQPPGGRFWFFPDMRLRPQNPHLYRGPLTFMAYPSQLGHLPPSGPQGRHSLIFHFPCPFLELPSLSSRTGPRKVVHLTEEVTGD